MQQGINFSSILLYLSLFSIHVSSSYFPAIQKHSLFFFVSFFLFFVFRQAFYILFSFFPIFTFLFLKMSTKKPLVPRQWPKRTHMDIIRVSYKSWSYYKFNFTVSSTRKEKIIWMIDLKHHQPTVSFLQQLTR